MDRIIERRFVIFVLALLFCFLSACPRNISIPPESKDGLVMISEWRSQCEQDVSRLKRYYKPEADEYKRAEGLYVVAKSKSDKWIDILITDLGIGGEPSKQYKSSLEEAAKHTSEFMDYVEGLFREKTKVLPPSLIGEVIGSLSDAGVKIWEAWRKANTEERARVIAEIRERKWKNFGEIK